MSHGTHTNQLIFAIICVLRHVAVCCTLQHTYGSRNTYEPVDLCEPTSLEQALLLFVPSLYYVLQCVAVCCSVLQCVAVCCSVLQCACSELQCVAVCLQCVAVRCSALQCIAVLALPSSAPSLCYVVQCVTVCCSIIQCVAVAVCCSVLQCVAVCCSVLAMCCNVLQCVVVRCSALQCQRFLHPPCLCYVLVCCSVL